MSFKKLFTEFNKCDFPKPYYIFPSRKYDLKRHSKSRRQMPWDMAVRVVTISCTSTRPPMASSLDF